MRVELEVSDRIWAEFCLMCEREKWEQGSAVDVALTSLLMIGKPIYKEAVAEMNPGLKARLRAEINGTLRELKRD